MSEKTTLKAAFFRENGNFYMEETMDFDPKIEFDELIIKIKTHFQGICPDMFIVILDFGLYDKARPIMLTPY